MTKGWKIAGVVAGVLVALFVWVYVLVTPQRAVSAAVIRDCMDLVSTKFEGGKGLRFVSAAAYDSEDTARKIEDFNRATQAVIQRGEMVPKQIGVLLEYGDRGVSKATCEYFASFYPESGGFQGVRLQAAQGNSKQLDGADLALWKMFNVGLLDRFLSILPISSDQTKFLIR